MKTYFPQFIDKFLKFEEIEYHHVKFEMWPILYKLPILFSTVKLKLEHNFSQLINRFKIDTLESLSQVVLASVFSIPKEIENLDFRILVLTVLPNILNSLNSWEIGILEVPMLSYFFRL